ncbi:unnamed protein product, partial [Toxocara canis]|uniref:Peptidase_M1 domain-containing protein n=1 Tax=Toxocara canis TaxID=6265 RepID=A0A183U7Y8_TOXCA
MPLLRAKGGQDFWTLMAGVFFNGYYMESWFFDHDYFYMVFEKMRGGPLLNHIQQKGFFTEQEASKVTRDIANAL